VALEQVHVAVHAAGGGGPERSRWHCPPASWPVRHSRWGIAPGTRAAAAPASSISLKRAWAMSRADHDGAGQQQRVAHLEGGQLLQRLAHGPGQVDPVAVGRGAPHRYCSGKQASRVAIQLLDEQTVPGDLRPDVAVGGTGDRHAHRAAGAVARQADDPDVMGEVFAAELRPDPELLGRRSRRPSSSTSRNARPCSLPVVGRPSSSRRRSQLDGLQDRVRASAADHEGDVIRRARRGTQALHLLHQVRSSRSGVRSAFVSW
jgi:hypothetical protein